VSQGVDAECGLLDDEGAENTGIDEAAEPIAPAETSDKGREGKTCDEDDLEIVAMLPNDNRVLVQIRDVGAADSLWVLLHQHPAEVRIDKTLADGVGILLGVGVSVVCSVVS
jgi:hypothetical protein